MKELILILLIITTSPGSVFGQKLTDKKDPEKKYSLGIRAGLYLSNYAQGSTYEPKTHGVWSSFSVNSENQFKTGYNFGFFLEKHGSHHFSIQPEINYISTKHDIRYSEWYRVTPNSIENIADYVLSSSFIQLSILPKLSLGNHSIIKLLAGPYVRIPVYSRYEGQIERETYNMVLKTSSTAVLNANDTEDIFKGGIGAIIGLRVDIPFNANTLGVEIRAGEDINDTTTSPSMKETSMTFSLIYFMRLK